jgi:hypothetical protein
MGSDTVPCGTIFAVARPCCNANVVDVSSDSRGAWSALRAEGDDVVVEVELLGDVGVRYHADVRLMGSHPIRVERRVP